MSDLCADPACSQIREWHLADAVKLAQIRRACLETDGMISVATIHAILDADRYKEPQP